MRRFLAALLLLVVCAPSAFGWGQEGHRIVCRIAYQSLTPAEQAEVDRLTKAYETPPDTKLKIGAYPDACIFPDEARTQERGLPKSNTTSPWRHFKPFADWHFINVDRNVWTIPEEACQDDCVLTGITTHAAMLKNGATDQERGEGLFFLGHWVGDVHQPLHVSYANDQGGNKVVPVTGGFYPVSKDFPLNLHAVWDGAIIRKAIVKMGWRAYADQLEQKITDTQKARWVTATPLDWAQESYDLTTLGDVEYCRKANSKCAAFGTGRELTADYQTEFLDDVELRLQKAGVRLAALIHAGLAKP
jgi:hypothetical protein